MTKTFVPMHKVIPEGKAPPFAIEHFTVSEADARLDAVLSMGKATRSVNPGKYARLRHGNQTVMSDTFNEQLTNYDVVHKARGDVLIAGLGLGMILIPILKKPEVTSVLVLEKFPGVRQLVEKPLRDYVGKAHAKLWITDADVFTWDPTTPAASHSSSWDTIYFDIWNDQSTDDLKQITQLKRKFARRKRAGGWMGAWCEDELRYRLRRERASAW